MLIYLVVAITCFWLIILPLVDDKKFLSSDLVFSTDSLTVECNLTKVETDTNGRKLLSTVATVLPSPTAAQLKPHSTTNSYSAQSSGIAIDAMSLHETVLSMGTSKEQADFTQHAMMSSTPAEIVSSLHPVTSFPVPTPPVKVPRGKRAENASQANITAISANQTDVSTYTTAIPTYTTTISIYKTAIPTYTTISNDTTATLKNKTVTSAKLEGPVNCETDTSDPELVYASLLASPFACSTVANHDIN